MAAKFKNNKGFLIIEMTPEEAINKCAFGYIDKYQHINFLVCDDCNDNITYHNKIYYVALINSLLCKDCCEYFVKNFKHYKKDKSYEVTHYNYYANKVGLQWE